MTSADEKYWEEAISIVLRPSDSTRIAQIDREQPPAYIKDWEVLSAENEEVVLEI